MNRLSKSGQPAFPDSSASNRAAMDGMTMPAIDLIGLYSILRLHLKLILLVTMTFIVGMFVYLQSLPPVYTAYSQVILDTRKEKVTPAQEMISSLNVTNSVIAGEIITIKSNILIGEVVDQMNLIDQPELDPRRPRPESPIAFLKRIIRGGEEPHVFASKLPEETLRSWVIEAIRRKMSVSQIGVSYAIGISFENSNPELAAAIAEAVAERYIDSQLETKMRAALRANAWLADRLAELSKQVEKADAEVVNFKAEMIEKAGGNEKSINQLLAELNTKLVGSSTERADAEVRLGHVEALREGGGLGSVGDVLTSPLLETLQRQRAERAASKAQMASTLGRKHPDMMRISAQIADIDRSIDSELRRRIEEMRGDVDVTRNREAALKQQIAVVSQRANSLSKDSVRLSQLESTASATRLVYENFLARFKETSAQADFQTSEARVIGEATVPVVPSGPKKTMMMVAATVFGLAAAIAFVFLRNFIRSPITSAEVLRSLTHLPTMAVLPHSRKFFEKSDWLKKQLLLDGASPYLDRVQSIRTHLYQVPEDQAPKIIMITSSVPNEGKTSLSCSLAKVLAQPKKSVLLVDADLRRPDVRETLEMPMQGGCLVDYFEKKEKLQDLIQHSDLLGVDVISSIRAAENPADIIAMPMFAGLLVRLTAKYDVIVMNGPPVLHLADAVLLGKLADATLLAVQSDKTSSKVVANSLRRLKASGVAVTGTVLTMVRRSQSAKQDPEMYSNQY